MQALKVTILTIPKSWSVQKVEEEFGVSNYMARKAKDLVKNQGIQILNMVVAYH